MIDCFDDNVRKEMSVHIAVALIAELYSQGKIKKRTYDAVVKDSRKMIESKSKL